MGGDLVLLALSTLSLLFSLMHCIWLPLGFSTQPGLFHRELPYTVPFVRGSPTPFFTKWFPVILSLLAYPSPPPRNPAGLPHLSSFLFHTLHLYFLLWGTLFHSFTTCKYVISLFTFLELHSSPYAQDRN